MVTSIDPDVLAGLRIAASGIAACPASHMLACRAKAAGLCMWGRIKANPKTYEVQESTWHLTDDGERVLADCGASDA